MGTGTFNTIMGRHGETLAQKWEREGTRTLFGIHSYGFPNLMIMSGPQGGGGGFNFTLACEEHGDYMQWLLTHMRDQNVDVVDVKKEDEDEYAEHCAKADQDTSPLRNCLTYYNGEGTAQPGSLAYYGTEWG